jgi:hypothetical protein
MSFSVSPWLWFGESSPELGLAMRLIRAAVLLLQIVLSWQGEEGQVKGFLHDHFALIGSSGPPVKRSR